jgi:hypothetical protein
MMHKQEDRERQWVGGVAGRGVAERGAGLMDYGNDLTVRESPIR